MLMRFRRLVLGIMLVGGLGALSEARGQGSPTIGPPTASMMANPYANPYMNPFMNPYMTQGRTDPTSALLFFYGANQAAGGIGSGRLSSSRPAPDSNRRAAGRLAAEMPVSALRPGGAANRFFQRGLPSTEKQSQYGRRNRYFANNGR
jgi:hypothetical protein